MPSSDTHADMMQPLEFANSAIFFVPIRNIAHPTAMRRLKDLDVHEISLVKRAANKRRYLIVKSDLGASEMAKSPAAPGAHAAQNLMAAMAAIPREKIEHIAAIAKSAKARIAKADEDGSDAELQDAAGSELSEDAQNALKAAFRILAPYSDAISADTMADFSEALGVEADVAEDGDAADADETVAMSDDDGEDDKEDDVGKADAEGDDKKDPLDNLKKADDDSEDEEDEKTQKAAEEEVKDKVEGEDVPPSVAKADGMPDFADADDSDLEAAMAAARTAYAAAMEQRGKKQATQKAEDDDKEDDDDDALTKSAIEKSAFDLSALDKRHQRILEPVFKSHLERFSALERANKELIAKSAKLDDEMRRREFITKAAREYSALGPAEEIGDSLLRLHKKDPEGVAAWERIMKAANEQMRQGGAEGLFDELGTAMSGGLNSSGLPDDEIRQHVDAIVQKSATGKSREMLEAEFLLTPVGRRLYAKSTNRN